MDAKPVLAERQAFSRQKLAEIRAGIARIRELQQVPDVCLYATGSFARGEASRWSDLDIFFITQAETCAKLSMTLISADLIRLCREMGLPEFSGDGRYLQVHGLTDIEQRLGSPDDDYHNSFTARLLLLLESTPLARDDIYWGIVKSIVDTYFRDYHDHNDEFRPVFLANDVLRFWKTLCLNYEHKRNRPANDDRAKHKNHLKNLKLKFSRMTTCFSAILALSSRGMSTSPEAIVQMVGESPLRRIERVAGTTIDAQPTLQTMLNEYSWFLDCIGRDEESVLVWLADVKNRVEAFKRAKAYGDSMYRLLNLAADPTTLRYLMI